HHRAGRWHSRDWVGRLLRTRRRAGAGREHRPTGAGDRTPWSRDRGRDLRLHQRQHHRPRAELMASPRTQQTLERLAGLTPKQIVDELDRYSVGQADAKKAVAIALRNRWRRQRAPEPIREEISPNNIILVGPTGVGKTEIARRLAKLAGAPFVKVEASKFTEVGHVGGDVGSMVRDLAETAVSMLRDEERERVRPRARDNAEERLLDVLLPPPPRAPRPPAMSPPTPIELPPPASAAPPDGATRENL